MDDYEFIRFEKSKAKDKKYVAILRNKKTNKPKLVNFGSLSNQHYKDSTGLNLYSHLNHNYEQRRKNFKKRFARLLDKKYTATWFSNNYLW